MIRGGTEVEIEIETMIESVEKMIEHQTTGKFLGRHNSDLNGLPALPVFSKISRSGIADYDPFQSRGGACADHEMRHEMGARLMHTAAQPKHTQVRLSAIVLPGYPATYPGSWFTKPVKIDRLKHSEHLQAWSSPSTRLRPLSTKNASAKRGREKNSNPQIRLHQNGLCLGNLLCGLWVRQRNSMEILPSKSVCCSSLALCSPGAGGKSTLFEMGALPPDFLTIP